MHFQLSGGAVNTLDVYVYRYTHTHRGIKTCEWTLLEIKIWMDITYIFAYVDIKQHGYTTYMRVYISIHTKQCFMYQLTWTYLHTSINKCMMMLMGWVDCVSVSVHKCTQQYLHIYCICMHIYAHTHTPILHIQITFSVPGITTQFVLPRNGSVWFPVTALCQASDFPRAMSNATGMLCGLHPAGTHPSTTWPRRQGKEILVMEWLKTILGQ